MKKKCVKASYFFATIVTLSLLTPLSAISATSLEDDSFEKNMLTETCMVPDLVYSPTSHDFGVVQEGNTYQTIFKIWNGGTSTLTWNLGIVHTWISPNPTSGSSTGPTDKDTVTVTIDTTGLTPGIHNGFVSISANDGGGVRYFNIQCEVNEPPNTPSTPTGPSTGETGIYYTYSTSTTDPEGDMMRYGSDADDDDIVNHWSPYYYPSGATYIVNIKFPAPGTYHLRIKAEDVYGGQSDFSLAKTIVITGSNHVPNNPSTPVGPSSGEIGIFYDFTTSTSDPDGDDVKYGWDWNGDDVIDEWTGLSSSGTSITTSHSWTSPGTYNIKVVAEDEHGAQSDFSLVKTITISGNNPPNKPATPTGPSNGKTGFSYTYATSSTDPDGDQVYYMFDWGDGTDTGWLGPYTSGQSASASHSWTSEGTFPVKVKAKDTEDAMSVWSDSLLITLPRTKESKGVLPIFFENHPLLFSLMQKLFQLK
ncbi:MAG: PKD domain-containing protein [Candidatus Thermoplasmatota archaeon]|nr:PKD domain-containing protein [Candidatus Thermoplasmatota archaeon]